MLRSLNSSPRGQQTFSPLPLYPRLRCSEKTHVGQEMCAKGLAFLAEWRKMEINVASHLRSMNFLCTKKLNQRFHSWRFSSCWTQFNCKTPTLKQTNKQANKQIKCCIPQTLTDAFIKIIVIVPLYYRHHNMTQSTINLSWSPHFLHIKRYSAVQH